MKIYTIGFTQKNAQTFFTLLRESGIQRLVDIRLRPSGQLAGFARQEDLPYFLQHLADGCQYIHLPELTPTKEILDEYRSDKDWQRYVKRFEILMDERHIPDMLDSLSFAEMQNCLLCSEASPQQCHRRLVAERMAHTWSNVEIIHL